MNRICNLDLGILDRRSGKQFANRREFGSQAQLFSAVESDTLSGAYGKYRELKSLKLGPKFQHHVSASNYSAVSVQRCFTIREDGLRIIVRDKSEPGAAASETSQSFRLVILH